ncbi:N/A [soil metagenome]
MVAGQPLTIAHVLVPAPYGGLERVVCTLARAQQAAGHRVGVVAVVERVSGHPFLELVADAGVAVHVHAAAGRAYGSEYRQMKGLCARLRPDIIHTHGYRADVVDGRAARTCGVRTVSTVHGYTGNDWKNRFYEYVQNRAHRHFDAVIAVSKPQVARLTAAGVGASRIRHIPNAWSGDASGLDRAEARRRLGYDGDAYVIGWVGRLSPEKGADILLDALRSVPADDRTVVSMLGSGRDLEALRQRAAASGLGDRVVWHGAVAEAGRFFPAFDLFVLSSRTEGTPMVLFEAMAAGVPVVAAAVGGVPCVVGSDEAWLVEPESPTALAAAIRAAMADPEEASRRAAAARLRLRSAYDVETWVDRHDSVYRAVMNGERSAP